MRRRRRRNRRGWMRRGRRMRRGSKKRRRRRRNRCVRRRRRRRNRCVRRRESTRRGGKKKGRRKWRRKRSSLVSTYANSKKCLSVTCCSTSCLLVSEKSSILPPHMKTLSWTATEAWPHLGRGSYLLSSGA